MTEFMQKILKDVVGAINALGAKGCLYIEVARVREHLGIPTSDRSAILFIAKALGILARHGFLDLGPRRSPKQYQVAKPFTWADVAREQTALEQAPTGGD